jgi:hypothetical protein
MLSFIFVVVCGFMGCKRIENMCRTFIVCLYMFWVGDPVIKQEGWDHINRLYPTPCLGPGFPIAYGFFFVFSEFRLDER